MKWTASAAVAAFTVGGSFINLFQTTEAADTSYDNKAAWMAAVADLGYPIKANNLEPGNVTYDAYTDGNIEFPANTVTGNQLDFSDIILTGPGNEMSISTDSGAADSQAWRGWLGPIWLESAQTGRYFRAFGFDYYIYWPTSDDQWLVRYGLIDAGGPGTQGNLPAQLGNLPQVYFSGAGPDRRFFGVVSDEIPTTPQVMALTNGGGSLHVELHQLYWAEEVAPFFDFAVTLDDVTISLTNSTDFTEAIVLQYTYTGAKAVDDDNVDFTFDIFQDDCDKEFAPAGNTSKALYLTGFDETVNGKVSAKLGIDLNKIESASEVWSHPDNKETQAILKFCGRNIYVKNVLFQFHESNVTATINLKEDGGFNLAGVDVGLDRKDADAENQDIEVEFPVKVFFCNDTAGEETAPTEINQGTPIQVCLELETNKPGVYVQGIDTIEYSATEVNETMTLIDAGSLKFDATAEVDCTQVAGRCRIKWLAMAAMYVNIAVNKLVLSGLATIAFGSDQDQARRQVAFDAQSGGRRSLSDEVGDSERLAPFDFTVGNLQPFVEETSPKKEHGILFSVLGGVVLLAIVCAAVFFVRRGRPVTETTDEKPRTDKHDTTLQASSLSPSDESQSETSESFIGYQVAHV